jgi:NAD(P)-dependent dehydrogenase (short-subunit alcohol dehydrogenase family)
MAIHAGKVAVCVGSATGIGAESAWRLATEGAKVMVGDVNLEAAQALIERIRAAGGEGEARKADIADEAQVNALIQGAAERYGGLDLMHVNAVDTRMGQFDKDAVATELAVFDRTLEVGLRGHLLCTRAAIPLMLERGRGSIVYTASDAAKTTAPSHFSYYVMKAGLNALMRHVAVRWGREGVRSNSVCPGVTLTDTILRSMPQEVRDEALRRTPSPRLGEPRDIASLVSFLLSDDAEWINGQAISIDGGGVMHG